ncbi:calponin homology domain-containing protein DDB_G0272472-like isoform X1 [Watersipora subatra]|uniref:calponin homology domain-containing protein DDB_G0272472-like isoform X1 n=1 Tax=Watersipora subatra TaxID=2589382 RepID=UPI00355BEC65
MEELASGQKIIPTTDNDGATLDERLEELPQAERLSGGHGKEKAAVMRRNVAGRKKPTRQGLRDSLLKSLEESELQSILMGTSITEESVAPQPVTPASPSTPQESTSTPVARTHSSKAKNAKGSQPNDFTNDLFKAMKQRESKSSTEQNPKVVRQSTEVKPSTEQDTSPIEMADNIESPPVVDRTSKPKSLKSPTVEDSNKDLFNLPIRRDRNRSTNQGSKMIRQGGKEPSIRQVEQAASGNKDTSQTEIADNGESPPVVDRSSKPKISLGVIPSPRPVSSCTEIATHGNNSNTKHNTAASKPSLKPRVPPVTFHEAAYPLEKPAVHRNLNNNSTRLANEAPSEKASVSEPSPWSVKLRKIALPSKQTADTEVGQIALPNKPKLRPVSLTPDHLHKQDNNTLVTAHSPHLSSISSSSEPKINQTIIGQNQWPEEISATWAASPSAEHMKRRQRHLKPLVENSKPARDIIKPVEKSLKMRRPVGDTPKMRRPVTISETQPEWIKQAAEKHKRASMVIEQADALANLSKGDNEPNSIATSEPTADPFVKLRCTTRSSRSSSIESNSTSNSEQNEAAVPAWKLELNQQSRLRRLDRNKKALSAVEPAISSFSLEKENWKEQPVPSWRKKEPRTFSKGSVLDVKESSNAEPEFIKLFNKRQDRLKKAGSLLLEAE